MNAQHGQDQTPPERQYPREYFAAPVYFACRISQLLATSLIEAINSYTGLYREITGRQGLEAGFDPVWAELVEKMSAADDPEIMTHIVYDTYLDQPHSVYNPERNLEQARVFGALGYGYDAKAQQARIHFFGKRSAVSALSSSQFQTRRGEFGRLLEDVRQTHPVVSTIKSSTWLQNIPNYRNLFPPKFQARLRDIKGSTYLGIWGQFVRGDGHGNQARLDQFRARLSTAQTVAEAIDAFPLKVLEAVGPIEDFYAEYKIQPVNS